MINPIRFSLIAILPMLVASFAHADLVITVGNGLGRTGTITEYSQGDTVSIPVFLTTSGTDSVAAFDLAMDFGRAGFDLGTAPNYFSPNFTNFSIAFDTANFGNAGSVNYDLGSLLHSTPELGVPVNFDFIVRNIDTQNRAGTYKLFDMKFTVGQLASGIFDVKAIMDDPSQEVYGNNTQFSYTGSTGNSVVHPISSMSAGNFAFNVTAVPEPSSFLLGSLALGLARWRMLSKKIRKP
jgi:hypothetical protein